MQAQFQALHLETYMVYILVHHNGHNGIIITPQILIVQYSHVESVHVCMKSMMHSVLVYGLVTSALHGASWPKTRP